MPDSPLQPVAAALFKRLNVASLKAVYPGPGAGCLGGVTDNPAQNPTFPFLWYEITGHDDGGLGQGPDVVRIDLRLHVFSTYPGMAEAQRVMREAIRLLKYSEPLADGYEIPMIGRPLDEIAEPFSTLNGVSVRELVTVWELYACEVAA